MKNNATLEDVLSALCKGHSAELFLPLENNTIKVIFYQAGKYNLTRFEWQINKPFSEQSSETKQTLNKIL